MLSIQVQMASDNTGVPIFATYPHLGSISDIRIYNEFPPPTDETEVGLADKGYQGALNLVRNVVIDIFNRSYLTIIYIDCATQTNKKP